MVVPKRTKIEMEGNVETKVNFKDSLTQTAIIVQKKQAAKVNKNRTSTSSISIGTVVFVDNKGVSGKNHRIYGIVVDVITRKGRGMNTDTVRYKLKTRHGVIKELFGPERTFLAAGITLGILKATDWDDKLISLKTCIDLELGRTITCQCKGDCSKVSKCRCKIAGLVCTTKCHGGNGKNSRCQRLGYGCNDCPET